MENFEKRLKFLSLIIGIIGIAIVLFFINNPDPFSQKFFSRMKMGGMLSVWIIVLFILFSIFGILTESLSFSSNKIMLITLILIAGFSLEVCELIKLNNSFPMKGFFGSYFIVMFFNFIAITILFLSFSFNFIKTLRKSEDFKFKMAIFVAGGISIVCCVTVFVFMFFSGKLISPLIVWIVFLGTVSFMIMNFFRKRLKGIESIKKTRKILEEDFAKQ